MTASPSATITPSQIGQIGFIDPAIVKLVDPALALPGEIVTWTLYVSNRGNIPATGQVVTDTLSPTLEFVSASAEQGTYQVMGQTIIFNIGTVNPGQVIKLTIITKVRADAKPPIDVINQALLDGNIKGEAALRVTSGKLPATGEQADGTQTTAFTSTAGICAGLLVLPSTSYLDCGKVNERYFFAFLNFGGCAASLSKKRR